nr:hypothetical protein [Rhodococcus erythropolis]
MNRNPIDGTSLVDLEKVDHRTTFGESVGLDQMPEMGRRESTVGGRSPPAAGDRTNRVKDSTA